MGKTHYSHPGGILKRQFLDEYGLSVNVAAKAMGLARTRLNDIVLERRDITAETALFLGKYFGNGPEFWMNLQSRYDLEEARAASKTRIGAVKPLSDGSMRESNV